jgi:hypothetical protein
MVMPFASNPDTSMFPKANWSDVEDTTYCEAAYGLRP